MRLRGAVTLAVVAGALGFGAGVVLPQDGGGAPPGEEDYLAMVAEASRPGKEHEVLAALEGTWETETTAWRMDGTTSKSKGVSVRRRVLGGRYVLDEHQGELFGRPFRAVGLLGYSKERKQYFGLLADEFGTTPEVVWGAAGEDGRTLTYDGTPTTTAGVEFTPRWVLRLEDADHFTFERHSKMAGMRGFAKETEVRHTRRR